MPDCPNTLSPVAAPAKLNLALSVARARPDGFHPLSSWFVTTSLTDRLTVERLPAPGQITLTCSDPALPTGPSNLVHRAAALLLPPDQGVRLHLEKHTPAGGGLGGGSSDAAATLRAVARLFGLDTDLAPLAERLGSDVPFFLSGGPSALCTGRGEVIDPLPPPAARGALLFLPDFPLSTPAVFAEFDRLGLGSPLPDRPTAVAAWRDAASLDARNLLPRLVNDLEVPAFALAPRLGALRDALERRLGRPVRMSGSGSTLFTLFDTEPEAAHAAAELDARPLRSETVKSLPVGLCVPPDVATPGM